MAQDGNRLDASLMARSSATRHGTGAGWGGPAKGASKSRFKPRGDAESDRIRHEHNSAHAPPSVADLMADAGARELAASQWLAILKDPKHPKHAEMVAKAAERLDGAPVQPVRGEGEGIVINVVKRGSD